MYYIYRQAWDIWGSISSALLLTFCGDSRLCWYCLPQEKHQTSQIFFRLKILHYVETIELKFWLHLFSNNQYFFSEKNINFPYRVCSPGKLARYWTVFERLPQSCQFTRLFHFFAVQFSHAHYCITFTQGTQQLNACRQPVSSACGY